MERLPFPLLWFSALVFGLIGLYFLAWPERAAASIGLSMTDSTGRTDVRATYGGLTVPDDRGNDDDPVKGCSKRVPARLMKSPINEDRPIVSGQTRKPLLSW